MLTHECSFSQPAEVVRLAKRKVDDLEELESTTSKAVSSCSAEEVAAGTELLRKFLEDWSQESTTVPSPNDGAALATEAERQVKRLRVCVCSGHTERIQGSTDSSKVCSTRSTRKDCKAINGARL